ncbi:MAG: septal ring lytic transglycosylase RlpA family protein [Gammaproteobacteria bacterium]
MKIRTLFAKGLIIFLLFPQLTACNPYRNNGLYTPAYSKVQAGVYPGSNNRMMGKSAKGYDKVGYASWYGLGFHGRRTASHEPYNMYALTAASPTLPIPSFVQVTNLRNGRTVVVKINDRGPFHSRRIIDLSYAAAQQLGYARSGVTMVRVTALNSAQKTVHLAQQQDPVYLQVGNYKSRQTALLASKKVAALTKQDVAIKAVYHNQQRMYHIHLGPLANADESQSLSQLLVKNGYQKPVSVE